MRIVIVSQYFPPETGGPQNRLASLARGLDARGHEVHVITAKPNYPTGEIFPGYKDGWFVPANYEGVPVTHCWILPDRKKTTIRRILFYVSFMASAVVASLRTQEVDVVLASSPPLFVGIAGWAISRLKGARYVFDVRDLWPDVAVAMGELDDGWMAAAARSMERFIYRTADGITAVTESFCRDIDDRVDPGTPVVRIPNGTSPESFQVAHGRQRLRERLGLPGEFLVTYAGTIGLAQGLPHVLETGELLDRDGLPAKILLVGDGPLRESLRREATSRGVDSVLFRERVPLDQAAEYMAASDALLVPLGNRPIYRKFIPSKLFDAMAVGRPILLSVDGEARDILDQAGAGIYYPAEDASELASAIRELMSSPELDKIGARGREFVVEHYSRAVQAKEMARFLERIVADERADRERESGSSRVVVDRP